MNQRNPAPNPIQPRILRAYSTLLQLHPMWSGLLVLSLGLSPEASALPIASNIAGAVSLAIDDDPVHLREIVRSGAVDFVVNSLDEAIRAMKNELRKQAPLSVALQASPLAALEEAIDRGLAPQLFSSFLPATPVVLEMAGKLRALGADLIDFSFGSREPYPGFLDSETILAPKLTSHSWQLHTYSFETSAELRDFDAHALNLLPSNDLLRRRWLEAAPRILQRQRPPQRSLWLAPQEADLLRKAVNR
jgi:urocanate hydratase